MTESFDFLDSQKNTALRFATRYHARFNILISDTLILIRLRRPIIALASLLVIL